jgi:hypothetical protein
VIVVVTNVVRSELRNVLAGYLRRGSLSLVQTLALQTQAEELLADGEARAFG